MDKLPDYLIENYIIPYLSSYDLFYKFRTLGSFYYYCARNKILTHFPEEMMKTLKKIIDFNTKEDLTKNFDEITKQTFNEKRALLLLMLEMNISLMINKILETSRDDRILELIALLYVITKNEDKYRLVETRNFDEIQRLSATEEGVLEMRKKISEILEEDDLDFDLQEYITVFGSLDREFLLENNYTGALYNYVRLLIEFCHTKIKFNNIKTKLEIFFKQITEASEIWPRRRTFYEKSIDLIADTQILSNGAKKMIELMKKYDIENDLTDYVYDKEKVENYNDPDGFIIIKNNRKKLNMAILRLHQMYAFYIRCIEYEKKENEILTEIDIKKIKINVGGRYFDIPEFLYILSMIKKEFQINEASFLITKEHLKHCIFHQIYHIEIEDNNEKKEDKKDEDKKEDTIKGEKLLNIAQIDLDHLQGGIHDLQNVLENTKLAGKEINESFQKFTENLENLNSSLSNENN